MLASVLEHSNLETDLIVGFTRLSSRPVTTVSVTSCHAAGASQGWHRLHQAVEPNVQRSSGPKLSNRICTSGFLAKKVMDSTISA